MIATAVVVCRDLTRVNQDQMKITISEAVFCVRADNSE